MLDAGCACRVRCDILLDHGPGRRCAVPKDPCARVRIQPARVAEAACEGERLIRQNHGRSSADHGIYAGGRCDIDNGHAGRIIIVELTVSYLQPDRAGSVVAPRSMPSDRSTSPCPRSRRRRNPICIGACPRRGRTTRTRRRARPNPRPRIGSAAYRHRRLVRLELVGIHDVHQTGKTAATEGVAVILVVPGNVDPVPPSQGQGRREFPRGVEAEFRKTRGTQSPPPVKVWSLRS